MAGEHAGPQPFEFPDAMAVMQETFAAAFAETADAAWTANGFSRIGERCGRIGLPTAIIQEGGYVCDALGENLAAFMGGFASAAG